MYCRVNALTVEWNVAVRASFFNLRHRGFPVLSKQRRSFVDHHFENAGLVSLPLPRWFGKQRHRVGRVTGGDYRWLWSSGAGLHFCNFNRNICRRSDSPMKITSVPLSTYKDSIYLYLALLLHIQSLFFTFNHTAWAGLPHWGSEGVCRHQQNNLPNQAQGSFNECSSLSWKSQ